MGRVEIISNATLYLGDCRDVLALLPENSFDACVTDPPYGLGFMGKEWDSGKSFVERKPVKSNTFDHIGGNHNPIDSVDAARTRRVETQKFGAWCESWARAVYRVLKPGAHLIAFGGTRTYHRLACAIEDAGFEIRDCITWVYGSGFPKSHDVSKGIDRMFGGEREVGRQYIAPDGNPRGIDLGIQGGRYAAGQSDYIAEKLVTAPATDAARQWDGWGTALKPAAELICLARKPLSEATVAANVLKWGCGAINVDGCRVAVHDGDQKSQGGPINVEGRDRQSEFALGAGNNRDGTGRWPANLVHDGSAEVTAAFPDVHGAGCEREGSSDPRKHNYRGDVPIGQCLNRNTGDMHRFGDSGSAARFFYTAKADADDRLGSKHPTVKPLDLMQWLVRLVCRRGGVVLDPFAGTGTTGEAAWREGVRAELIEREAEYAADIRRRMALVLAGPDERLRESVKAKALPRDDGPLFACLNRRESSI